MKLKPTTKPVGKPTVKRMWVVSVGGQDCTFCDADIAHRFYDFHIHRFPTIKEINCE